MGQLHSLLGPGMGDHRLHPSPVGVVGPVGRGDWSGHPILLLHRVRHA